MTYPTVPLPCGLLLLTDDEHGDITRSTGSGLALDITPASSLRRVGVLVSGHVS